MANEISERIITLKVRPGAADVSIQVPMVDITDGKTPETGLTPADFDLVYSRVGAAAVKTDCAALALITTAHTDFGCIEVDSTNMKGVYRFDLPDAVCAAGKDSALVAIHHTSCRSAYIQVNLDNNVKLTSDGLDSVSVTAPTGLATTFREMMVAVWRLFFKKVTMTATQKKTYADNGSSILTTQTLSDDGTTQEQGAGT